MATEAENEMIASTIAAVNEIKISSTIIKEVKDDDETKEETKDKKESKLPIPVTIFSGFLGSGKTTLLKHILESPDHKMKVAVIVNDMAELNIDSEMVLQSKQQ
eukprot:5040076-Ditylum_brightwellii.AAC.1